MRDPSNGKTGPLINRSDIGKRGTLINIRQISYSVVIFRSPLFSYYFGSDERRPEVYTLKKKRKGRSPDGKRDTNHNRSSLDMQLSR